MTAQKRQSLKPRKTPRQSRSEKTVAMILDAVAHILETKGLDGLNTNAVAKFAGVSVGSLYQYFPGKDALIVALSQRERAGFLAMAEQALIEPTGQEALGYLIAVSVRQQSHQRMLARVLDFESKQPAIAKELETSVTAFRQLIRQILTYDDVPAQSNIDAAIEDLVAVMYGIVDTTRDYGEVDYEELEYRVGRGLFGYLGMSYGYPKSAQSKS